MSVSGRCLCGAVRYELATGVRRTYRCHCSLCRKQGSTRSSFATLVDARDFRWTAGEDGVTRFRKPTGFSSFFCSRCGASVPNPLRDGTMVWVPLGGLEAEVSATVVAHLYVKDRAPWDDEALVGRVYDEMPELQAFVGLFRD